MLDEKRKLAKRKKLSSIVNIILGMIWISMGLTRTMAENKWNIALVIIGAALIALSISVLKNLYLESKAEEYNRIIVL